MGLLLPQLPFAFDDLEPAMSEDALSFHFARHHLDHFERTAALAQRAGLGHLTLEELVCSASRAPRLRTLYRHAAEAWNHACFWESMRAGGGGAAYGAIGDCLGPRLERPNSTRQQDVRKQHLPARSGVGEPRPRCQDVAAV